MKVLEIILEGRTGRIVSVKCAKRDLAGVGVEWRKRARNGGGVRVETVGGDGSETGLVTTKKGKIINDRYGCHPHPGLQE